MSEKMQPSRSVSVRNRTPEPYNAVKQQAEGKPKGRRTGPVPIPDIAQVEAELRRLRKSSAAERGKLAAVKAAPAEPSPRKKSKKRTPVRIPTVEEVLAEREALRYRSRFRSVLMTTIGVLLVVAAAAALIATLCLPVLQVSGSSMEPTLNDGDIIVLVKNDAFEIGDLVGLYYNGKIMLKRVIGQAGDYVNIDSDGNVYVNGEYIDEPYVVGKSLGDCDIKLPYQVPDSTCFVLGDHRSVSTDSRNSTIGCIKKDQIIGKIVLRIWPINNIAVIN